jgi:very-short-patch-repair endonuclease
MLIVEVDGGQHSREEVEARDARRTKWLEREGYRVLRFWNNQVLAEMEAVIETIAAAMGPTGE